MENAKIVRMHDPQKVIIPRSGPNDKLNNETKKRSSKPNLSRL